MKPNVYAPFSRFSGVAILRSALRTLSLFAALLALGGCEQTATRHFGGSMRVELPSCTKLVNATWKANDLWYLVRPMREGEHAEESAFIESSTYGAFEGRVLFVEHCK